MRVIILYKTANFRLCYFIPFTHLDPVLDTFVLS